MTHRKPAFHDSRFTGFQTMRINSFILLLCAGIMAMSCSRGNFDERMADAEARLGAGNAKIALKKYISITKDFKDDSRCAGIFLRIADLYSTTFDDPASAVHFYGEAIDASPLSYASQIARERRAALLEKKGDYEGAIEDYAALIKHFGNGNDEYRYRALLASVYISDRNYRQARIEIKPLVEGKDVPADMREQAVFIAAESFFIEGRQDRAAEFYQWFLNDFPKSSLAPEAKLHFATCLESMGYLGMARDVTRSAAGQYPNKKVIAARIKSLDERGAPMPKEKSEKAKQKKTKKGDSN